MKIIEKDKANYETLLGEMKYNYNTVGEGIIVGKNEDPHFKRELGVISIFSMMCLSGYYDEAKNQTKSNKSIDIVNRMMDHATRKVDNTFAKDDNWSARI